MKSFLNPASKTILWIILVAIIMTLEVQFMLDGNILYALYLLLLNTHIWLFIWPALSIIGCTPAIIKPSQPIDFQPLQIFLKIYGWTLLVGFVLMFEFLYVSGRSYFFTLEESQNYLIPFIFIWSVLPVLCLLACFIARITAPKINLLEWDKRNPIIYICIFISILLIGGIWASMILTDREKGYFPYMVIAGLLTGISLVLLKSAGSYLWEAIQNKHTGGKIYAAFYFSSLFVSAFYLFSGLLSDTYGIKQGEVLGYSLYHTLFFTRQIVLVTLSVLANMWLTSHKKRFFYFATTFLCGIIIISETISIREENSHLYQNLYAMSVDEWGGRNNKQENTYGIPEIEEDIQEEEILAEMMWPGEDYFIHSDFSFAFLWDNPEDNRDSISAAQSYFHNYGYLTGAWSTLTEITDWDYFSVGKGVRDKVAYQTLMKFLYDYRTTIDLPGIANSYLPYLNRIIPEETYTKTGMRTTVHQLLLTYDDIMEENQDVNRLIEIGKVMDENGKMYIPDESYEEEEKRFFHAVAALTHAADYAEEFTGWSGRTDYQRITWAYSFWTRRYYEGIHQEVHTILKQIEQVYQET